VTSSEAPLCLGIDAVEVERFRIVLARRPGLTRRLFAATEQVTADGAPRSVESLAARFAAKEATMKVLGAGLGAVSFLDICISTQPSGAPTIELFGRAKSRASALNLGPLSCSLTHTKTSAMAVVGSVRG
jgi:holo-[acyl-carrier protein] synthase